MGIRLSASHGITRAIRPFLIISLTSFYMACSSTSAPTAGPTGEDTQVINGDTVSAGDTGADVVQSVILKEPPPLPEMVDLCAEPAVESVTWPMDAKKISISVFHFNIQYVAGGLDDYFGWTMSAEEVEDRIITESFEPLVDLFERHPNWGGSFEMQGLMLEILAQRHPEIARRFHKLVRRGQVDLMSFHWSDQLVTALTRQDMLWSWAENQALFEKLCMPRAKVHFLQEGQFGPGISQFITDKEGGTLILPRNLLSYHHAPAPTGLLFENDGHPVLVTNDFSSDGLSVNWNFADDGELLATHNANPYLGPEFKHDPEFLKTNYEAKLTTLEADGWTIAPISHYLAVAASQNIQPTAISPPVLDGSWQPKESGNMFIWMGGKGQAPGDERDNAVWTGNTRVRHKLRAVRHLIESARKVGLSVELADKWHHRGVRELLLAQVSDATGWRPIKTEVNYGLNHAQQANDIADSIAYSLFAVLQLTPPLGVDVFTGEVIAGATPDTNAGVEMGAPPPALSAVTVISDRPRKVRWYSHGADFVELVVEIPATENTTRSTKSPPPITLTIPLDQDAIVYSPALSEDNVRTFPLSTYAFSAAGNQFALPLVNGLLGVSSEWTMVLDLSTINLAASISPGKVVFEDLTLPAQDSAEWHVRFYPVQPTLALTYAQRLNVLPIVYW